MPAAYKVYANPSVLGGRFNLFKAIVKNEGGGTIRNMKVEYRIPKYIDEWTEAQAPKYVLPNQSVVVTAYPSFNQDITQKNSQSREKAEIRITYGDRKNPVELNESFTFTMMAVNDYAYTDMPASEVVTWNDLTENNPLAACFVTAEDPVIQYYTSQIQHKLLQGETAGVQDKMEQGVRFMMGIYEATLRSGMVYSSTSCVPANTGDIKTTIQRIRLPRDVITGNTGLCIELSFLYASIMRNAGMEPVIYFVPGHAYPGFKLDGQYFAIEATMIGGAGIGGSSTAQQAVEKGMEQLSEFIKATSQGAQQYDIVDINQLYRDGVIPMELRDDNFSKQKIDQLTAQWNVSTPNRGGGGTTRTTTTSTGGGNAGMSTFSRIVSFSYPAGWVTKANPYAHAPFIKYIVSAPNGGVIEVIQVDGTNNVAQAMQYIRQVYANLGMQISYQTGGAHGNYVLITGMSAAAGQQASWYGALGAKGNAVVGILLSSTVNQGQQILASLR